VPAAAALAATVAVSGGAGATRARIGLWLLAHAFYLAAAFVATRPRVPSPREHLIPLILIVGFVPRVALLPTEPALSEDVYRYLWDGRLAASGVNPFPKPPDDPSLARFRDGLERRLNHADVPTIYPPAAQLLFATTARIEATPRAWKAALLVLEVALLLSLAFLLKARGLPPERLLLYYWNPLVVVESFGSGHLDLAVAAFLVLALALQERRRDVGAGVAFALAVLTKYLPLLLVPALVRARRWRMLAVAAAAGVLLFLPFVGAGAALWGGLSAYARHWEFNGSLYPLLRALAPHGDGPRLLLGGLLAAASIAIGARARTLTGAALAIWAVFFIASPTLYPWYLVPAVALLPLHPDRGILLFSGLVALSYLALATFAETGAWLLPAWVPWVEYGGLAVAWIAAGAAAYARRDAWTRESVPT
jgi:hypothetical protein